MRSVFRLLGLLALTGSLAACHLGPQPGTDPTPAATAGPAATSVSPSVSAATATPPSSPTATAPTPAADTRYYGNFTPYPAPQTGSSATPGDGYRVVFSENLSRHGSRSVSSDSDAKTVLALWQRAADADALTDRGERLAPVVRKLSEAMSKIGYGELSALGKQEQQGLGQREGLRLHSYYEEVERSDDHVQIINTGVHRTQTSAESFVRGLKQTRPGLQVAGQVTRKDLHFGSNDPAYQKFLDKNQQWRAAYEKVAADNDVRSAAIRALHRLYSADFVRKISDPTDEAHAIWDLYRSQGTMSADVKVDMTPFLDSETAAAFAFDQDARWFYSRGPGITGSDLSYRSASPLLRDFFSVADARLAGGSTAAVYRFAHDNDLAPFAARLKLPGSTQLKSARTVYSWGNSDFRLESVTPMAGNIEWTLWRGPTGKVLLQVRQNEVPTRLGGDCQLEIKSGLFYEWREAKRCLGPG